VKKYVNLGCGERIHPDWINIDLRAQKPGVLEHDLAGGIPLSSNSADAVYSAAMLEHLRRQDVTQVLKETYRVLKPGGILRVGVPDLEELCRLYFEKLNAVLAGDERAVHDYDWILLEMLDQMVREKSGGDMAAYFRQNPVPNESFVLQRIGDEGRKLIDATRGQKNGGWFVYGQRGVRRLARAFIDRLIILLGGRDTARALAIGRFRLSGEAHHWMYDRFSLARELRAAGFSDPKVRAACESSIAGWDDFHLDFQTNGQATKPDLFFMEAIKPHSHGDQ
jgi:predicted SAM-dependent methyltransferase